MKWRWLVRSAAPAAAHARSAEKEDDQRDKGGGDGRNSTRTALPFLIDRAARSAEDQPWIAVPTSTMRLPTPQQRRDG